MKRSATAKPRNSTRHAIRVQLVDDQALVREGLARLVSAARGMQVVATAANIDDAIRRAVATSPDVVLLDLVMPGRGALDAARAIRQRRPNTKIILIDEFPLDTHLRSALRLGVAGYLTKHDSFGEIEKAVRAVHAGRQAFSPHVAARLVSTPLGLRVDSTRSEGLLATLTPREIEMLVCLALGGSVKQCAELLSISPNTADNHKSSLMYKLGVHKSADLTRFALRHGLVTE